MKIVTANSGSYPRVGENDDQLRLRKAYQKWEVGDLSEEELEKVYQDYTEEIIKEQEKAGLDIVTDGQLRWYDPLSHFAYEIDGCEINGLLRYFDTNFYFRQPVVVDDIESDQPIVKDEFVKAKKVATSKLKPVVTGPYTLSKYSIDKHYGDISQLTEDYARIIANEVKSLSNAGAGEIQINEPAILKNKEEYETFVKGMEILSEANEGSQLNLQVYFGDSTPLYERFQDLPVDLLGLDFTYSPDLPDKIEEVGSEKLLGLGLVNARNTKMENKDELVPLIKRIARAVDKDELYLNPSCGIEFLPRKRAFEKLERMTEIAKEAEEDLE